MVNLSDIVVKQWIISLGHGEPQSYCGETRLSPLVMVNLRNIVVKQWIISLGHGEHQ
jgi:hypothetical protein